MDAFPSEGFWRDLGINPRQTLRRARGPSRVAGISGWSHEDIKIATALTGEIRTLPKARESLLLGLIATRAPRAVGLLVLVGRYSQVVNRRAIKSVALENGFSEPLPRSRRLMLLLFQKNPDLLKRIQYRALAAAGSVSYPFMCSEEMNRRTLTARGFRERLNSALKNALDPKGVRRAEIDYVDAKKGDEAITFSVRFEQKPKRVEQWTGTHTDVPVRHAILRALPKYRMLEVFSRQGKNTSSLASALSLALWSDSGRFHTLSEDELASHATKMQIASSGVKLNMITLRSIEADNVGFDGSPSMLIEAGDLEPTVRQFQELDIELKGKVISWRVWVRYSVGDLTNETVVRRTRSVNRVQFSPEPPLEVKVELYRRVKEGLTELELH